MPACLAGWHRLRPFLDTTTGRSVTAAQRSVSVAASSCTVAGGCDAEHCRTETQRYRAGVFGTQKKGPVNGAFLGSTLPGQRRLSGCGRQQLPVLGQDDRIDGVNNTIRSGDVRLHYTGSIDP